MVGKIAGTAIRKSIVVLFLPSLLFWDTCSSFFLMFFVTCFCCFFGVRNVPCRDVLS